MIDRWIEKVAKKVEVEVIEEAQERQRASWSFKPLDRPPLVVNCPPPSPWPQFKYAETFYDKDKMLVSQLANVYSHCLLQDDAMLCLRANYGVGIIPSVFGSEIVVQQEVDNMPWVKSPIISQDAPDINTLKDPDPYTDGLMKRVLDTEEYFVKKLDGTGVQVYLCDTQSPLDIAYLLRGVKLMTDFYKYPDFVRELFQRISKTYVTFSEIQKKIVGEPRNQGVHGNPNVWMDRGGVRICEDVAVMLSPEIYRSFCRPFNEMCLKPFEGGMNHFCCSPVSDGRHVLNEIISNSYVRGFFFGSPGKFYDLGETVKYFRDKRVCLVWTDGPLPNQTVEEWVENITNLEEKTGVIFSITVERFEKAQKLMKCFRQRFGVSRTN